MPEETDRKLVVTGIPAGDLRLVVTEIRADEEPRPEIGDLVVQGPIDLANALVVLNHLRRRRDLFAQFHSAGKSVVVSAAGILNFEGVETRAPEPGFRYVYTFTPDADYEVFLELVYAAEVHVRSRSPL